MNGSPCPTNLAPGETQPRAPIGIDMSMHDTAQLATLVDLKRRSLVQIRDLGVRQLQLLDAADMTQLLKILAAKQHLIGQVQQIEQQLEPFRADDPERRTWATPA